MSLFPEVWDYLGFKHRCHAFSSRDSSQNSRSGSPKYNVVGFPECKPRQKSKPPLREETALVEIEVLGDPFLTIKKYDGENKDWGENKKIMKPPRVQCHQKKDVQLLALWPKEAFTCLYVICTHRHTHEHTHILLSVSSSSAPRTPPQII